MFDDLLDANARYATDFRLAELQPEAARHFALVTCIDSRIEPLAALGLVPGDTKILRNAGGRVTDDVVRSVAIAVAGLGVSRVAVMHHTDCAMANSPEDLRAKLARSARGEVGDVELHAIGDPDGALVADVELLRSSPLVPADLDVVGWRYDVTTGRITTVVGASTQPSAETVVEFTWTPEQIELRAEARAVAASAVERFGRHADSWINGYSEEFARELAARGWIGMSWPSESGGAGRPPIDRLIVGEELIAAGAPIGAMWFADRQMGPTLINHGRADQQDSFLPGILAGESTWCIGMSEPDAGSDLAGLQTAAVRDGDEWVINGQKIWTSFGAVADYCYLICRTRRDGPPHAGISEIIVPMGTAGIEVRPITDLTGSRHFCEVFFHDVRVPVENLVGTEGAAFKQTMRQLEHERGGIDRLVSNRALYELALERADRDDPLVRQRIAQLETKYRLGRLLVLREVLGQAPKGFSAATKCFCTEHEVEVADFVAAVLGMEATLWDPVTRGLAYAPAYTIMGGTSNILRNILAERVLGLPR